MADVADKTHEYNEYIREHRRNVVAAWKELQGKCKNEPIICDDWTRLAIDRAITLHDISKYSEHEFVQYRQYFYPCNNTEKDEELMESAWKHHYTTNRHHWEYWINDDGTFKRGMTVVDGVDIDRTCAYVEMICDWQAMGYKFGDNALAYYQSEKKPIRVADCEFVERILHKLCD